MMKRLLTSLKNEHLPLYQQPYYLYSLGRIEGPKLYPVEHLLCFDVSLVSWRSHKDLMLFSIRQKKKKKLLNETNKAGKEISCDFNHFKFMETKSSRLRANTLLISKRQPICLFWCPCKTNDTFNFFSQRNNSSWMWEK